MFKNNSYGISGILTGAYNYKDYEGKGYYDCFDS